MSKEKQIDRTIEYLNNAINVERNSYFGKGCITMPLIEADKILDILQGYRKQEWISVDERLPEENVYVLIAVGNSIQVARIIKGISEEKREKMKNGELPDPEESCFAADKIITLRRSQLYRSGDVWGNNLVPYYWKANGGPMEWFGQNITHWMPLPEPPKMKGGGE